MSLPWECSQMVQGSGLSEGSSRWNHKIPFSITGGVICLSWENRASQAPCSPCHVLTWLVWVSTEKGSLRELVFPGASVPREQDRNYSSFYDLASEVRQCYVWHMLFVTSESQESTQIQGKGTHRQGHENGRVVPLRSILDNSFQNFISLLVKWIVVTLRASTRLSIFKWVFSFNFYNNPLS